MRTLLKANYHTLNQLIDLLSKLNNEEYGKKLKLVQDNSIGKHVRHCIELYQSLVAGCKIGVVNYDKRNRELAIEIDKIVAIDLINDILNELNTYEEDFELQIDVETSNTQVKSYFDRELLYNLEHTIHHMAIISIITRQCFAHIQIDDTFGVAYSTILHQQQQMACAQ